MVSEIRNNPSDSQFCYRTRRDVRSVRLQHERLHAGYGKMTSSNSSDLMMSWRHFQDQYATIHVTPESQFSFASFETNIDANCLYKQTKKVVNCFRWEFREKILKRKIFRPGKLLMTVFANENSVKGKDAQQQLWECELPGYKRTNVQFVRLEVKTRLRQFF